MEEWQPAEVIHSNGTKLSLQGLVLLVDLNAALVKARRRVGAETGVGPAQAPVFRGANVHDHTRLHGAAVDYKARPPHLGDASFQRNIESVAGTDVFIELAANALEGHPSF